MSEPGTPTAEPSPATIRRWRRRLADEREFALIYHQLAARRTGDEREILLELASAEERHARYWADLLGERAGSPKRGNLWLRLLAFLARHLGWVFVLALVQETERRAFTSPGLDVPASMAADERIHGEVVRGLAARGRARLSGTLRAAVFGANDGLVSNAALVLGVIGGGASASTVLLTGLSGLLAGALSMAAGEYISVSSQRELLAASAPDHMAAKETRGVLDLDDNELALVYRARGMPADEAQRRAAAVLRGRDTSSRAPGTDKAAEEAVGSGIRAAWSSFLFFSLGAVIPVLPFLFGLERAAAVVTALALTGLALLLIGASVGVLSGGPPSRRALRQLAIGAVAAAVTYVLGLGFGATVG